MKRLGTIATASVLVDEVKRKVCLQQRHCASVERSGSQRCAGCSCSWEKQAQPALRYDDCRSPQLTPMPLLSPGRLTILTSTLADGDVLACTPAGLSPGRVSAPTLCIYSRLVGWLAGRSTSRDSSCSHLSRYTVLLLHPRVQAACSCSAARSWQRTVLCHWAACQGRAPARTNRQPCRFCGMCG